MPARPAGPDRAFHGGAKLPRPALRPLRPHPLRGARSRSVGLMSVFHALCSGSECGVGVVLSDADAVKVVVLAANEDDLVGVSGCWNQRPARVGAAGITVGCGGFGFGPAEVTSDRGSDRLHWYAAAHAEAALWEFACGDVDADLISRGEIAPLRAVGGSNPSCHGAVCVSRVPSALRLRLTGSAITIAPLAKRAAVAAVNLRELLQVVGVGEANDRDVWFVQPWGWLFSYLKI